MSKIPKSNELDFKCICCSGNIKPLEVSRLPSAITTEMLDDAMAGSIHAGYGSRYDTDGFIICLCDNCTEKAVIDGRLIVYSNHFDGNVTYKDQDHWKEEYKRNGDAYRASEAKRNELYNAAKAAIGEDDTRFVIGFCGDALSITCKDFVIQQEIDTKISVFTNDTTYHIFKEFFLDTKEKVDLIREIIGSDETFGYTIGIADQDIHLYCKTVPVAAYINAALSKYEIDNDMHFPFNIEVTTTGEFLPADLILEQLNLPD